jgi:tetratricopeptide (TPR) repeat protein/transglutaminase-like putative cysteine protease
MRSDSWLSLRSMSCILTGLALSLASASQTSQLSPNAKPDYSKEAFVIEKDFSKITFENDGTNTRESTSRIRIQSDAGVQQYSVLIVAYAKAEQSVDFDYIRVVKPDGTIVVTPLDDIQDMPSDVTRLAPLYSDSREKHIPVKGMAAGDVLEFGEHWHTTSPLAPGQFWLVYNFAREAIVLEEELQVNVPRTRPLKWKSSQPTPVVSEEGDRRIFTWKRSQLERKSAEDEKKDQEEKVYEMSRGKLPPPDVQLSTFQTWEAVGNWYNTLQTERAKPTPEIRAKAEELTKLAKDDNARLQAIYDYVSTHFRYIGVDFGIGRYQPHNAGEVLANEYGDCKDKHTLLAALLAATGIKTYPALINSVRSLDPDVPSPAQFDHVIGAVPQGSGYVWLDTTPEVAPFAYLLSPLRDKQALLVSSAGPSFLATTPKDPQREPTEHFVIHAKLSDTGTLEGKVDHEVSGNDAEVIMRMAFRRLPQPRWKDLVQQISYATGFAGDVSGVTAGSPEKTHDPFHFSYSYTRKDFPDWSNRKIATATPPFQMPDTDSKPSHPIWLGSPEKMQFESHIELPKGYSPELPAQIDLKENFAEYHSSYSLKDGVLTADRTLNVKLREVPVENYETYKKFAKAIAHDYGLQVALHTGDSPASYQEAIWDLPYSDQAEASRAYDDARQAYQRNDQAAEIESLKKAVQIDPAYTRAWLWLGEIYKGAGQQDLALESYRKAIDVDPHQLVSYKALGYTLMSLRKYEEAALVWQGLIKLSPGNLEGVNALGYTLLNLKRYSEVIEVAEGALQVHPDDANLYAMLGNSYTSLANNDKATAAFKKAVEIDPRPSMLNNIAYTMAQADKNLPLSMEYAQKAVKDEEEASANVTLSSLKLDDLARMSRLSAYWDTLGWVYFKMGNLDQAHKYVDAAVQLSANKTEKDHLDEIGGKSSPHLKSRLDNSGEGRSIKLSRLVPGTASADFFVVLRQVPGTSDGRIDEVKFIKGSDELKSADDKLKSGKFNSVFPDDAPTRLVRRGILACYPSSGCSFILLYASDVLSLN